MQQKRINGANLIFILWRKSDIIKFHCWYIEPRNSEKSLRLIWQRFSCLLDEWIAKISKKKFFTVAFWDNPHYPFWDLRSTDLKIFFGYDIKYLSIWPFMGHPWFPTRKASKLPVFSLLGDDHETVFRLLGDVILQQAENR